MDVVSNALNGALRVLYNNAAGLGNHWLAVKLVGTRANRDGQGAVLVLETASGLKQWQYATTCSSYLSAQDARVHVGLGSESGAARLEVRRPGGVTQVLKNVAGDRILTVTGPNGTAP